MLDLIPRLFLSREFLTRMMDGTAAGGVEVGVKDGEFEYSFQ